MNLTLREKEIFNQLTPIEQEFVGDRMESCLKNIGDRSRKLLCNDVLVVASADAGSPMANDAQILKHQTEALFNEIIGRYLDLTPSELRKAFKVGVRGDSGPWFGFCARTYHQFLKYYFELPVRQKSHLKYIEMVSKAQAYVPTVDKLMFSKQGCKKAFDGYQLTGELPIGAYSYYDIINDLIGVEYKVFDKDGNEKTIKTLVPDTELRKKIFAWAEEEYREELKKEMTALKFKGDKISAEKIQKYLEGGMKDGKGLERKQKRYLLKIFFDRLINEGKALEL